MFIDRLEYIPDDDLPDLSEFLEPYPDPAARRWVVNGNADGPVLKVLFLFCRNTHVVGWVLDAQPEEFFLPLWTPWPASEYHRVMRVVPGSLTVPQ